MARFFFFGVTKPDPSGHERITVAEDMKVVGGTQEEHERAVEIVQRFSEGVKRDGIRNAERILAEAVRKAGS